MASRCRLEGRGAPAERPGGSECLERWWRRCNNQERAQRPLFLVASVSHRQRSRTSSVGLIVCQRWIQNWVGTQEDGAWTGASREALLRSLRGGDPREARDQLCGDWWQEWVWHRSSHAKTLGWGMPGRVRGLPGGQGGCSGLSGKGAGASMVGENSGHLGDPWKGSM